MSEKNIVGVAEELLENLVSSRDIARTVKEKITALEEKLSAGTVSTLVNQELKKIVDRRVIKSVILEEVSDNRIEELVKEHLKLREDLIERVVRDQLTAWINVVKDTLLTEIIKSEVDRIFEEDADNYYQEVARSLIDNKLFQEVLDDLISRSVSKKIDEKLEVLEKLISKKRTVTKKNTKGKNDESSD